MLRIIPLFILLSCGLDSVNQYYFELKMMGVYETPQAGAVSSSAYEPLAQTFTLRGIYLSGTNSSGQSQSVTLFSATGDSAKNKYRITDTDQLIFQKKISNSVSNMNVTSVKVVFRNEILSDGRLEKNQAVNLDSSLGAEADFEATYSVPFTVSKGLNEIIQVAVLWKGTVEKTSAATESTSAPQVSISIVNKN